MTQMDEPEIVPGRRLSGRIVAVLATTSLEDFRTTPVERLEIGLSGLPGDRHHGFVRGAGSREPWYPRGTEIRNDRQISILSAEELAETAARLEIPALPAGWIGGNIVVEGIPRLSFLPRGTRLVAGGATIHVDHQNAPCRIAGRAIAQETPGREDIDLAFVREGRRIRGLVATVERAGAIEAGMELKVEIPEQWIYRP